MHFTQSRFRPLFAGLCLLVWSVLNLAAFSPALHNHLAHHDCGDKPDGGHPPGVVCAACILAHGQFDLADVPPPVPAPGFTVLRWQTFHAQAAPLLWRDRPNSRAPPVQAAVQ